jgi:ABC-type dipeptide/oligopeptide/nickel transport system permease component
MFRYIVRRVLLLFPTLLGTTLVIFTVMALSPGGVGGNDLDENGAMKPEEARRQQEYLNKRFGLDKPLPVQYFRWLDHVSPIGFASADDGSMGRFKFLKMPDLGYSYSKGRPVVDLVAEALPVTLLLNVIAIPITYTVSILTGIYAARRRGGLVDVTSASIFMALWSIPVILGGVLLIGFLASRKYIYLFPTSGLHDTLADTMTFLPTHTAAGWQPGWLLDSCWHLTLPIVCLTYAGFAFTSRLTRASMLENLASDFARTAKAKGVAARVVLFRHVFRNSLIPLITSSAGILPSLLGGALITESIFSLHGMGFLMLEAVRAHDRELVLDQALVVGGLGLLSYLIADVLYVVADPRVSYE